MRERYVRPPLIGGEPRNETAAIWRFRIVLGLALVVLVALLAWLVTALAPGTGERPGISNAASLRAVHAIWL